MIRAFMLVDDLLGEFGVLPIVVVGLAIALLLRR